MLLPEPYPITDTEWVLTDVRSGDRVGYVVRENGCYFLTDTADQDLGVYYTLEQAATALPSSLRPVDPALLTV